MYHESQWTLKANLIRKNTLLPIARCLLNSPSESSSLWSRRLILFKREVKRTQRIFLILALPKAQYGCTFIHWFTNIYLHLQRVVGSGNTTVNKTDKNLCMIFVLLWAGVINNEISKIYTIRGGGQLVWRRRRKQLPRLQRGDLGCYLRAHSTYGDQSLGHEGCPGGPGLLAKSELSTKKSVLSVSSWWGGWGCDCWSGRCQDVFRRTQSSGSLLYQWYGM